MDVWAVILAAGFLNERSVRGLTSSDISSFQGAYGNLHTTAVIIGGVFALIALVLSLWLTLQHLRSYTNPEEQKWIIGVLFMVPVYATESIISLWKPRFSIVCNILRDCYEAYALYSFGSYLVACLGGEERVVELLEQGAKEPLNEKLLKGDEENLVHHHGSCHDLFCQPTVLGKDLYTIVKFGLVQYMILKTLCSFLALLLELFGVYGHPYIAVVLAFSQMWALYCLVQFYKVTHHRLQPIKPLAKFISFKAIVFATWWQGVGITIICYFGVLPKKRMIRNGIQDFLICLEMAIAAVAHVYVFSVEPYRFLPVSEHGKVTSVETKTKLKIDEDLEGRPAVVEQSETRVEAPGTSVTESVQDVFVGGGEHVVKDVALTISQAIEPVEKGVTKIQETFHHISLGSNKDQEGATEVEVDEHDVIKENVTIEEGGGTHLISSQKELVAQPGPDLNASIFS